MFAFYFITTHMSKLTLKRPIIFFDLETTNNAEGHFEPVVNAVHVSVFAQAVGDETGYPVMILFHVVLGWNFERRNALGAFITLWLAGP